MHFSDGRASHRQAKKIATPALVAPAPPLPQWRAQDRDLVLQQMERLGLNQASLVKKLGMTRGQISNWLRGDQAHHQQPLVLKAGAALTKGAEQAPLTRRQ